MQKIPRVLDIPKILHEEINDKSSEVWTTDQIAHFSCLQIQFFQNKIRNIKATLSDLLGENGKVIDIIHNDFMIEYVDGTKEPIPQEKIPIVKRRFDEIESIENMIELSGLACVGIQKKSTESYQQILRLIASSLPLIKEGDWRMDLNNMKVIEIIKNEESENESQSDVDEQ